jgi:hypothetical protein
MIIEKQLETVLTLKDKEIYADMEMVCMNGLRQKFLNKCFMSCLIIDIKAILQYGPRVISNFNEPSASICVKFIVSAVVFNKYDIIMCKIEKKETSENLLASMKYAGIRINTSSIAANPYSEGGTFPVIVSNVAYSPMKHKISITALPFVELVRKQILYKITDSLKKEDMEIVKRMWDDIQGLEKQIGSVKNQKQVAVFQKLLRGPYANSDKPVISKKHIKKEYTLATTVSVGDYFAYSFLDGVMGIAEGDFVVRNVPALTGITFCMQNHIQYLTNLVCLTEHYVSQELIKGSELVWKTYSLSTIYE